MRGGKRILQQSELYRARRDPRLPPATLASTDSIYHPLRTLRSYLRAYLEEQASDIPLEVARRRLCKLWWQAVIAMFSGIPTEVGGLLIQRAAFSSG
jgi:hypothetical protein